MKFTNKRLVSILLCLAMVLAVLPMAVFAADTTTVYYYNASNWSTVSVHYWGSALTADTTWPGVAATDLGNGYWSIEVPSDLIGKEGIIFNNTTGAQTSNLTIPTTGENCFDGSNWIVYTGEELDVTINYYLRGGMNAWGADDSNKMTDNGDGTYSITMSLTAGTYEYKVGTADWSWGCPAQGNQTLVLDADCDVTFTLDLAANTLVATGDGIGEPPVVEYDYYVAGSAGLCGAEWDPAGCQMTEQADGTYAITIENVAAGSYEYKITTGSWETPAYGYDGNNMALNLEVSANVTITFDPASEYIGWDVNYLEPVPSNYIKWQLNADANAESATADLRLLAGLDSLNYDNVYFVIDGVEYACEAVYESVNENGDPVAAADLFTGASYVAAYIVEGVAIADTEIVVSVIYEADGVLNETVERTIVVSSAV